MPLPPSLQILAVYAALLGLMFFALSVLTIRARGSARVALGDGGDDALRARIRAHANFAEYVPLALILVAGAAITGAQPWFVHACGIALIAGRLVHGWALYRGTVRLRVPGMAATFAVLLAASGHILVSVLLDGRL